MLEPSISTSPQSDSAGFAKRAHLAPTALSQYVGLENCDRYLRFYLYKGETDNLVRNLAQSAGLAGTSWQPVQPLSGLLEGIGAKIEQEVVDQIAARGFSVRDLGAEGVEGSLVALDAIGAEPVYLYQVPMRGLLGRWPFEGRADLLRVQRNAEGGLDALMIDVKASRKDKVQHRLQVAVYVRMLEQMLADLDIGPNRYEGAIIRREADGTLQDPIAVQPFELNSYLATVRDLTEGPDAPLERVDAAPDYTKLHYYLGSRCDGCSFSPVCLTDTAERQDLSLIPFLESSDKRVLNAAGIYSVGELAYLKEYVVVEPPSETERLQQAVLPEDDENEETEELLSYPTAPVDPITAGPQKLTGRKLWLRALPSMQGLVEELGKKWPLAPRLDRLIQRAALSLRNFDRTTPAYRYFVDRNTPRRMRSNLPDDKLYPELIKIFVDAQYDYLEDRVYLVSALITNGRGEERCITKITPDVSTPASERQLLLEWVAEIFSAVLQVAGSLEAAPVHFYLYNRRDQRVLLDALRRNLDAFVGLPAFYHLLTDTPALNQSAIAFLYEEVRERLNLGGPLASLQVVSRQLGFEWGEFARIFRAGVFDYGLRRTDGVFVHTTARFYSGIPLEYAYAAWGKMEQATRSYKGVTLPQIEGFAAQRLRALQHIESNFAYKNSYIEKEAISLTQFSHNPPPAADSILAQVLEEFLHIEQYSNLQQHLELFTRPILRRVEQGRALLVRCTEIASTPLSRKRKLLQATFLAEFDKVGLHPLTALQVSKLKEGDFVTVTPLDNDGQPWKIVGGRLGRIVEFTGEYVQLELSGSTLNKGQKSAFRYFHNRDLYPQPGQYYMIDPMVDNLNGDKLQEACRFAEANALYKLALIPPTLPALPKSADPVAPVTVDIETGEISQPAFAPEIEQFLAEVVLAEGENRAPTDDQLSVIGGFLDEPLFLVQGPPGTGKSHTIGWATLARIYLAVQAQQSSEGRKPGFIVLVSSQTHNAVEIVLESIVSKWQQLAERHSPVFELLKELVFYKIGGTAQANRSPHIKFVDPWDYEQVGPVFEPPSPEPPKKKRGKKAVLEPEPEPPEPDGRVMVIGATPGNLYNLMKEYLGRGKRKQEQVWHEKLYDLLVLDEASQINLPHALLAAGWLKPQAQVIIVGDHRQLSPILAHGWEHEEHLPTVSFKPYRSVFQYFLDAGRPRVGLNESFRLHPAQAEFLQQQIYRQDGIHFHSRRVKRLAEPEVPTDLPLADYINAVLDPRYPVVVVEHNDISSQQYNQIEVDLLSPLIATAFNRLKLDGRDGVGIVVPHRAQKAILQEKFPTLARAGAIDTVERFQGGERDLIIVSTTASDPDYVASEAEFLLNPNRFNVALSRPRCKLVLVSARSIFQFVSANLELFEQSLLWKRLIALCRSEQLWQGTLRDNIEVNVYGISSDL